MTSGATIFPECTSMPAYVRGTYVHAWCRVHWLVPWTEEPGLCDPETCVSQTPVVQGVVSLLHPLPTPCPDLHPSPQHSEQSSEASPALCRPPGLPIFPPGQAWAGQLRLAAMVPAAPGDERG